MRLWVWLAALLVLSGCLSRETGDTKASSAEHVTVAADDIDSAMDRGLDFLQESQLGYGEFRTYACWDALMRECSVDSSQFVTTFVVYSLTGFDESEARVMSDKALVYISKQEEPGGVWRYYSFRNSNNHVLKPDVDDTSAASFLMKRSGIGFGDNRGLIEANRNGRGVFYTWLGEEPERNNVDCAVNANVLFYFGRDDPDVCAYINDAIISGDNCSVYYPGRLSLFYMVSRALKNNVTCFDRSRDAIIRTTLAQRMVDGSFGGDLETALALNVLLDLGYNGEEVDLGVKNLVERQATDGSWRRGVFFIDSDHASSSAPTRYFGSEELTTGFAIEALKKYKNQV